MAVPGHRLDRMMNPATVVVVGDKGPRYMWLNNFLSFKRAGGRLYSVQIDPSQIPGIEALGVTNFTALADVPEPIDYALVAVPRQIAPRVLNDLIAVGAHGAAFFTSGFAETGEDLGRELEQRLTDMALEAHFNLVGPNCIGLHLPQVGLSFGDDCPVSPNGRIGFLSQSGTHGSMFAAMAERMNLHLSLAVSFGNGVVLDVADYLEYLTLDPQTEIIGVYLEGVRKGRAFFEALREACRLKPVVVWKGGQTEAGALAIRSHTGSMASARAVWDGLMRQTGAIPTHNIEETLDVVQLLNTNRPPSGRGVALLAMTGGQSVSIADAFGRAGLTVPRLSPASYQALASFFNIVGGSFQNPLDMAGTIMLQPESLNRILRIVLADPEIQAVVMEFPARFAKRFFKESPDQLDRLLEIVRQGAAESAKPLLFTLQPGDEDGLARKLETKLTSWGLPVFPSFERAATALARVFAQAERRRRQTVLEERSNVAPRQ